MSSTVVVPPPNSSSLERRVPRLTAKARSLLTTMNLHFAGVAALLVIVLYLIVHLVIVWRSLNATNEEAIEHQQIVLHGAEIAAKPLRGLDAKLVTSTHDADAFYQARLPYATSQVAAELGVLAGHGVHLSRAQYAYGGVLSGADALTEMRIDASISGDYRPVMDFINSVERDKMFFVISSINLTGQESGQVNLRIRLTTYLRSPNNDEMTRELKIPGQDTASTTGGAQ